MVSNCNLTANGATSSDWNPFWCAGKVGGEISVILSSFCRVSYTVSRGVIQAAGVYKITLDSVHPRGGNYLINTTNQSSRN